jgi:hypothetical protein
LYNWAKADIRDNIWISTLRLKPGQYRLKFVVDDSWRCSKDIPTATDEDGTFVNWLEVEAPKTDAQAKDAWPMDAAPPAKDIGKSASTDIVIMLTVQIMTTTNGRPKFPRLSYYTSISRNSRICSSTQAAIDHSLATFPISRLSHNPPSCPVYLKRSLSTTKWRGNSQDGITFRRLDWTIIRFWLYRTMSF